MELSGGRYSEGVKDLYPHQRDALAKLKDGKVLWGGVGSGKTLVAAIYYKLNHAPKDVYVITTAKKRDDFDWQQQFYELGIGPRTGPSSPGAERYLANNEHDALDVRTNRGRISDRGHNDSSGAGAGGDVDSKDRGNSIWSGLEVDRTSRRSMVDSGEEGYLDGSWNDQSGPSYSEDVSEHDYLGRSSPDSDARSENGSALQGQPTDSSRPRSLRRGSEGFLRGNVGRTGIDSSSNTENDPERGNGSRFYEADGNYPWSLTVDSWNNIAKYADVAGAFFIFDEQRLVGSGQWSRKFLRIAKRNAWILLSATPGDTWMDYVPLFVANNFYKNRTEFKREHVVYSAYTKFPKVERYINVGRLERQRSQLLVEMPYLRHTTRKHIKVSLEYDKDTLDVVLKQRWHVYEERPLRDVAEMFIVARRVVNSHPSRLEKVVELWEKKHPRLIVFYNFNFELESLRSLAGYYGIPSLETSKNLSSTKKDGASLDPKSAQKSSGISESATALWSKTLEMATGIGVKTASSSSTSTTSVLTKPTGNLTRGVDAQRLRGENSKLRKKVDLLDGTKLIHPQMAEWNGHKHQAVPVGERWLYFVQYTAGAEGWDCTTTDAMILYSLNYSWKIMEQSYGRIDRLNTPYKELSYYGFTSDSWVDRAIQRSLTAKETFNANKYGSLFDKRS